MAVGTELIEALNAVQSSQDAHKVFETVSGKLGISGWEVARTLGQNPDETARVLRDFTQKGIFQTPTEGGSLEGNYSLTSLGFTLKEQLSGGRFSRG